MNVGDVLPELTVHLTRADLVQYAGASGDFNIIHWNERVAKEVGLPNVIAHGMLTMGVASRLVSAWVGDPGLIRSYSCKFTRPVVVPDDSQGATVTVNGEVTAIAEGRATISLNVTFEGATVLGKPTIIVELPAA